MSRLSDTLDQFYANAGYDTDLSKLQLFVEAGRQLLALMPTLSMTEQTQVQYNIFELGKMVQRAEEKLANSSLNKRRYVYRNTQFSRPRY